MSGLYFFDALALAVVAVIDKFAQAALTQTKQRHI